MRVLRAGLARAVKALEDAGQILGGDADSCIANRDTRTVTRALQTQGDAAARLGIGHGIV